MAICLDAGLSYKEAMLLEISTTLAVVKAKTPTVDKDNEEWGEDG